MFGVGCNIAAAQVDSLDGDNLPTLPEGFAFVVTDSGKYVVDGDGNYIISEEV